MRWNCGREEKRRKEKIDYENEDEDEDDQEGPRGSFGRSALDTAGLRRENGGRTDRVLAHKEGIPRE